MIAIGRYACQMPTSGLIKAAPLLFCVFLAPAPARGASLDSLGVFFSTSSRMVEGASVAGAAHLDPENYFEGLRALHRSSGGRVFSAVEMASPLSDVIESEAFDDIRGSLQPRRFREVYRELATMLVRAAAQPAVVKVGRRLEDVQRFFPELDPSQGQWSRALMQSINDYLYGRDRHAVLRAAYALSLNPVGSGLGDYIGHLEARTGIKAPRAPSGTGLSVLEVMMNRTRRLYSSGRTRELIRACRDVLVLKPDDATALARLGSAHYLRREYGRAAAVWKMARKKERRADRKKAVSEMIFAAKRLEREAKVVTAVLKGPNKADLDAHYRAGVLSYARGNVDAAEKSFSRILEVSPGDVRAKRALRRVTRRREEVAK